MPVCILATALSSYNLVCLSNHSALLSTDVAKVVGTASTVGAARRIPPSRPLDVELELLDPDEPPCPPVPPPPPSTVDTMQPRPRSPQSDELPPEL